MATQPMIDTHLATCPPMRAANDALGPANDDAPIGAGVTVATLAGSTIVTETLANGIELQTVLTRHEAPRIHAYNPRMLVSELGELYDLSHLFKQRRYDVLIEAFAPDGTTLFAHELAVNYTGDDLADIHTGLRGDVLAVLGRVH